MVVHLPPLKSLRAFEATARHGSVTRAADELNVTQAAVSHQIKGLEEYLAVKLFHRRPRKLELTVIGRRYAEAMSQAFEVMQKATSDLRLEDEQGSLKVSVLPSFAAKWLVPRLVSFRARYPDIDVLVLAANDLVNFDVDDVDVAIRLGSGNYPGLRVDMLFADEVLPVCSPALLEQAPLYRPQDLKYHTILHDDTGRSIHYPSWETWANEAGIDVAAVSEGPFFSDSAMVVDAACAGQGVALARRSIARPDLLAGRLISPFGPVLDTHFQHYLVCPEAVSEHYKVRVFREWLFEEVEASS